MRSTKFILAGGVIAALAIGCGGPQDEAATPTSQTPPEAAQGAAPTPPAPTSDAARIEAEREQLDATVWADEALAQEHEQTIVRLWDALRPADDKWPLLAAFPFDAITLGASGEAKPLPVGITHTPVAGGGRELSHTEWQAWIGQWVDQGYLLESLEFHQGTFTPDPAGATSTVSSLFHVRNADSTQRWVLKGTLRLHWGPEKDADGYFPVERIAVEDFTVLDRAGTPQFAVEHTLDELTSEGPILCYDLDGDGLSEVVLPAHDKILWNRGNFNFEETSLFEPTGTRPPQVLDGAVLADFTNDGHVDMLCTAYGYGPSGYSGVWLFRGDGSGRFNQPGERVHREAYDLRFVTCITAGDMDGDGDLDVWIGQYRQPYFDGQMPTPFYDANDGYKSYLLENRGNGAFEDVTEARGLGEKRFRRVYSGSFHDFDEDGDEDLLVVADFAGIDIYFNDGTGHFSEVTDDVVDERRNFGMAHTFADYDRNGRMDYYVIGMSSTTARRLDFMGLNRAEFPEVSSMRTRMGYGNRMYLQDDFYSVWRQPDYRDTVARTGWSWGVSTLDFNVDGWPDIYVANGHYSGQTAKDYCTKFWCHDIYTQTPEPDPALEGFFLDQLITKLGPEMSWDGFQHNNLLMNMGEAGFVNVAYLMGVAFVEDSRAVITDDFDGDGLPDLLVSMTRPTWDRRGAVTSVKWARNQGPAEGQWIGVRIDDTGPQTHAAGARITLGTSGGTRTAALVTGDSFRAQHANRAHFGLAAGETPTYLQVQFSDGTIRRIDQPALGQYHALSTGPEHLAAR